MESKGNLPRLETSELTLIGSGTSQDVYVSEHNSDSVIKVWKEGSGTMQGLKFKLKMENDSSWNEFSKACNDIFTELRIALGDIMPALCNAQAMCVDGIDTIVFQQTRFRDIVEEVKMGGEGAPALPFASNQGLQVAAPYFRRHSGEVVLADLDNLLVAALESIDFDIHNRMEEVLTEINSWAQTIHSEEAEVPQNALDENLSEIAAIIGGDLYINMKIFRGSLLSQSSHENFSTKESSEEAIRWFETMPEEQLLYTYENIILPNIIDLATDNNILPIDSRNISSFDKVEYGLLQRRFHSLMHLNSLFEARLNLLRQQMNESTPQAQNSTPNWGIAQQLGDWKTRIKGVFNRDSERSMPSAA